MKGDKLFFFFISGSFIVAIVLIFLYRAIETNAQIYAFMFLSMLIILLFSVFLLELIFLEPITDEIIDVAQDSRLLSNILLVSLFLTGLVILPIGLKNYLENEQKTNPNNCSLVLNTIQKSSKSIYDTTLLRKCPYTEPITKIIPANEREIDKSAQNFLFVIAEYMELFAQNISFAFNILVAMLGGVSYAAFATLFVKKFVLLIISIFNASALKMFVSHDD